MDESDVCESFATAWTVRLLTTVTLAALLCLPISTSAHAAAAGATTSGSVDLAALDKLTAKFDLEPAGPVSADRTYVGVRSAALLGDVDGDGLGDVALGDPNADPRGRTEAGSVYVIFGRRGTQPRLSLADLGNRGYRIDGRADGSRLGASIAALGDSNGDNLADFAIGAPRSAVANRGRSGTVYVVHGDKAPPAGIDTFETNPGIVRLLGAASGDRTGWALASLPEPGGGPGGLIIGAPTADPAGRVAAGSVYVLPRPLPRTGNRQLAALPGSYRIDGAAGGGRAGSAVGSSPDMSGDGLDEVLIGAPLAGSDATGALSGLAYVVPARPIGAAVDLAVPTGQGMTLYGEAGMRLGTSILGIGDVSGDGVPDVAVGAPFAAPGQRAEAGSVFVVAGRASSPLPIGLPAAPDVASRLDGVRRVDRFGTALARADDLDRDGVADLLVGAPGVEALGRQNAGALYAVRGRHIRTGLVDIALGRSSVRLAGPVAGEFTGSVLAGGHDAGRAAPRDLLVTGRTSAAALDLPPSRPDEPPIPPRDAAGCPATRDIELVVDDSGSLRNSDPQNLRRAAIEQMLSKPRDTPIRLGAIEIGRTATEVFAPLSIEATGLGQGVELETLRGLLDERIRNDAGATDFTAGLIAAAVHNPLAGALVIITDATEPAPAAPLPHPGRPVYVLQVPARTTPRTKPALLALARATGGTYFEGVDAVSLPAALGVVEADLRCEQTLTTNVAGSPASRAPAQATQPAPAGSVVETADLVATATATAQKPARFVAGLPATSSAITMTLSYSPGTAVRRARGRRPSCVAASPVTLRSVEVIASDTVSVRATAAQLRQALRGRTTPIGSGRGVKLNARGRCGRGYLTLRITGLERLPGAAAGAQAASRSQRRANMSAKPKRGTKRIGAGTTAQRRRHG